MPRDLDHLPPQRAQRLGVDQQHALVVEPDPAVAGRKVQARHQVGQIREADLVDIGLIVLQNERLAMVGG